MLSPSGLKLQEPLKRTAFKPVLFSSLFLTRHGTLWRWAVRCCLFSLCVTVSRLDPEAVSPLFLRFFFFYRRLRPKAERCNDSPWGNPKCFSGKAALTVDKEVWAVRDVTQGRRLCHGHVLRWPSWRVRENIFNYHYCIASLKEFVILLQQHVLSRKRYF